MKDTTNTLQKKWIKNQLIGLDLIYDCSELIRFIDIDFIKNSQLIHSYQKEYFLSYEGKTTLDNLLQSNDDLWSEIQINNKILIDDKYILLCGEGEMGSDGFIVKTDINNNILWFLYSTTSNPFINIEQKESMVYFRSTSNFDIALDLINSNIFIENENTIFKE
ncbi:hypothetical protein I4902_18350 [Proteus alimentorum]|uniref:SMI1/KNR4 family protein n=1 Tax=Proteus alimentorum TaxID=1973495 RepID=A0ABS0J041_9GAMM|nr:hypothetical protein [Proteus alimentorum]MBG2877593.1 hypothetical protein [Proteus alimentorum]MBG2881210.1 hypothetical protein [Proteus alimentorum]